MHDFIFVAILSYFQLWDALYKLEECGIAIIFNFEMIVPVMNFMSQSFHLDPRFSIGLYKMDHIVGQLLFGNFIVLDSDCNGVVCLAQLKIIDLLQKLGQRAIPVVADIEIRILFHQPAADLPQTGIFVLVSIFIDDRRNVVLDNSLVNDSAKGLRIFPGLLSSYLRSRLVDRIGIGSLLR